MGDGERVVSEIEATGSEAVCVAEDLSATGSAEKLFDRAIEAFGTVDAPVNSAGATNRASAIEATPDDWQLLFRVNAEAPLFIIRKFLNHRRELKMPGEVVNILPMNTHGGASDLAVHSASKSGFRGCILMHILGNYQFSKWRK